MQGLVPSPPFSREVVRSLGTVACCSNCFSIHNPDYFDYYATLGPDSGSDSCCYTDSTAVTHYD